MLNSVNINWNAVGREKDRENARLLLESNWREKIPEGKTPIDTLYCGENLYICISNNILDCESLIESESDCIKKLWHFNIFDAYSKIITFIDPNCAVLLSDVFGNRDWKNVEETKHFFEGFLFLDPEDMKTKVSAYIGTLTQQEADVIRLYYGLHPIKYGVKHTLAEIAKMYGLSSTRIAQCREKALHKLRHPSNVKMLTNTNTILDQLQVANDIRCNLYRSCKLYRSGVVGEETLIDYYNANINCLDNDLKSEIERVLYRKESTAPKDILDTNIDELGLSVRAYNCLWRSGINTVRDLADKDIEELRKVRNMGAISLEEILSKLKELGVNLKKLEDKNELTEKESNDKNNGYVYFISYTYKNTYASGVKISNCYFTLGNKIDSIEIIRHIEDRIKTDLGVNDAKIINYILVDKK